AVPIPDALPRKSRGARPAGAIRLGSEEHLRLFCLELLETHDPYKPAVIAWPTLDAETRHRIIFPAEGARGLALPRLGTHRHGTARGKPGQCSGYQLHGEW